MIIKTTAMPEARYMVALTEEEYGAIGACIEQAADICNGAPDRDEDQARMTATYNMLLASWRIGMCL